jgi:hypothetical protein
MAYNFNGTNQSITDSSTPVTEVPLSIAFWANMDVQRSGDMPIVVFGNSNLSNSFRIVIANRRVRVITFQNGNSSNAEASPQPAVGTWFHGAGVWSAINNRTAYVDGGSPSTNTTSRTPSGIDRSIIGSYVSSNYTDGQIAEIGVWNAALTATEIFSLSRGVTCDQVRPQSLVFYAPLIRDLSDLAQGRALTNNNGATVADHPRIYS